jgi:hypothetical protein
MKDTTKKTASKPKAATPVADETPASNVEETVVESVTESVVAVEALDVENTVEVQPGVIEEIIDILDDIQATVDSEEDSDSELTTSTDELTVDEEDSDSSSVEVLSVEPVPTNVEEVAPQVIAVSGIAELLKPLMADAAVVAQSKSEPEEVEAPAEKSYQTKQLEFDNWFWNNRFAPASDQEAERKRIFGE